MKYKKNKQKNSDRITFSDRGITGIFTKLTKRLGDDGVCVSKETIEG